MHLTLYHYVHCPFCVRVRMALGLFKLPYKSIVVPYDDEKTPINLMGKKMLPIMVIDGKAMNESLDIISVIDTEKRLKVAEALNSPIFDSFNELLNKLGTNVHNLAMPYWIYTPEFNEGSRAYFQKKKEQKRGPFKDLVKRKEEFTKTLLQDLSHTSQDLVPYYRSKEITIFDIMLAAHLWGLYVVPEFQFPENWHNYLQRIKRDCAFDYHQDFWE